MNEKNTADILSYHHKDGIATLTLNNPPQNRLSSDVLGRFGAIVTDLSQRTDTRVIYIKSEGPNFSFGGDISPWINMNEEEIKTALQQGLQAVNMLEALPIPVVVAIQGHCLGGGFELALRADIIIAADDAKFGHPEASISIFTLLGGVQRVAERVGRTRAMQWAMTCEFINAKYAQEIGLINQAVPLDELYPTAETWVQKLAKGPTLAHADHKKLLRAWSEEGIKAADELMPDMVGKIMLSKDAQGSIASAITALKEGKPRPAFPFKGE